MPEYTESGSLTTERIPADERTEKYSTTEFENAVAQSGVELNDNGRVILMPSAPYYDQLHSWYDATQLEGYAAGDGVSTWPDYYDENAQDLTAGVAPSYRPDAIGGRAAVYHDGGDERLASTHSTVSPPYHLFAVLRVAVADTGSARTMVNVGGDSDTKIGVDDTGAWELYSGSAVTGGSADTNAHIITALFDGANSHIRVDGGQTGSGDIGTGTSEGIATGHRPTDNTQFTEIEISELLFYPTDMSAEQSEIESHLSDKWGVSLA